jgi:hypothetical protein
MTSLKKISDKDSSKENNIFLDYIHRIQKSKKCNINNRIGIITPKDIDIDCFSSNSKKNSLTEQKNKKEMVEQNIQNKKVIKINILDAIFIYIISNIF